MLKEVSVIIALLAVANATCPDGVKQVADAVVPDGFCAFYWVSPGTLQQPRQIVQASNGDVLTVEAGPGTVTVLWEDNNTVQKATLTQSGLGLTHALNIHGDYLYASSDDTVYRWKYTAGDRTSIASTLELVVVNVPCCHHVSRAILFDEEENMYVQVGSGSNVDPDPTHAMIRVFANNAGPLPVGGVDWTNGTIFAYGMRNEAGIHFDNYGRLWGVENGRDDLERADLGGDIHNTNPCEELNLFDQPEGSFYGYPYCWSTGNLTVNGSSVEPGVQWADPGFIDDGIHTDEWCKNASNVVRPVHCFQAHVAPLEVIFDNKTMPPAYQGMFVSFHGSWDREPPRGYRVVHLNLDDNGMPISEAPFFAYQGPGDIGPTWTIRPVGLLTTKTPIGDGLLISDDGSGSIIGVAYVGN